MTYQLAALLMVVLTHAARLVGADRTRIYYIGLKGVGTDHKRRAVQAVYELKPMAEASDIKALGSCAQVE